MSDTTGPIFTVTVRGNNRQGIEASAREAAEGFFGELIKIELDSGYQVREVEDINCTGGGKYIATINARQATGRRTV